MPVKSKGPKGSNLIPSRFSSFQDHVASSNVVGSSLPSDWSPDVSYARQALGRIKARRSAESAMFLNSILRSKVTYDSLSSPENAQPILSWTASPGIFASPLDARKNVDDLPPFSPASFLSPPLNRSMLENRTRQGGGKTDEEVDYIKQLAAEEMDGLSSYALLGVQDGQGGDQVSQSPQMSAKLAYALEQSQSDYRLLRARQELFQHLIHKTINENLTLVSEQKESLETLHDSVTLGKSNEKALSALIRSSLQCSSRMHLALLNLRDTLVKEKLGISQIKTSRLSRSSTDANQSSQNPLQEHRNGNQTVQLALEQAKEKVRLLEAKLASMNEAQDLSHSTASSRYVTETQLYIERQLVESLQAASNIVGEAVLSTTSVQEQESLLYDELSSKEVSHRTQTDRLSSFLDTNAMQRLTQLDATIKLLITKLQQGNTALKENQSYVKNLENEIRELEAENRELSQELSSSELQVRVLKKELEESFEQVERHARLGERSSETNIALRREVDRLRTEVQILSRANFLDPHGDPDVCEEEVKPAADRLQRETLPHPESSFELVGVENREDNNADGKLEEENIDEEVDEETLRHQLSENQSNMMALSAKLRQSIQDWRADQVSPPAASQRPADPSLDDDAIHDERNEEDEQVEEDEESSQGAGRYDGLANEDTGVLLYIRHEYPVGQALEAIKPDSKLSRSVLSTVADALCIRDNWMKIKDISPCDDFWEVSPAAKSVAAESRKTHRTGTFKVTLILCNEETTGVSSMWILAEMQRQLSMSSGLLCSHDHPFRILSVCDISDGDKRFAELPPEPEGGLVADVVQECDRDWENELHDLRLEIQDLKDALDKSQKQYSDLIAQHGELKKESEEMAEKAAIKEEEERQRTQRHQTMIATLRMLANDLQLALDPMEPNLRDLQVDMAALLRRNEEEKGGRIRIESEVTRLRQESTRREGELEDKNRILEHNIQELQERVTDLNRRNEELSLRCSTSEELLGNVKLQAKELTRRNEELVQRAEDYGGLHAALSSSLGKHAERLEDFCDAMGGLDSVGASVAELRREASAEKTSFTEFLTRLRAVLREENDPPDEAANSCPGPGLDARMEAALARTSALKQSMEVQRKKFAELQVEYEEEQKWRKGMETDSAEHARELSKELRTSTAKAAELEASVAQTSKEASELRAELEGCKEEMILVRQERDSLMEEVDAMKTRLEEQDKAMGDLRETLEERHVMNNDLEEMLLDERQFGVHFAEHCSSYETALSLIDRVQCDLLERLKRHMDKMARLEASMVAQETQLQQKRREVMSAGEDSLILDRLLVLDSNIDKISTLLLSCCKEAEQTRQAGWLSSESSKNDQVELRRRAETLGLAGGQAEEMLSQLLALQGDVEFLFSVAQEHQDILTSEARAVEEEEVDGEDDDVATLQCKVKAIRTQLDASRSELVRMERWREEATKEKEELRAECSRLQKELDSADAEHSRDLEKAHSALTAARLAAEHEVRRNGAGSVVDEVERQHKRFSRASGLLGRYILDCRTMEDLLAIACPLTRQLVSCEMCVVYLLLSNKDGGLVLRALVSDKSVEQYAARMMEAILPAELQKSESNLSSNDSWEKESVTHVMDVQLGSKGLLFHAVHNEQTVLVDTPGEDERYDPETDGAYLTRWTIREDKEVGPMACVPVQWPNGEVVGVLQACRWREAEVYNPHDVDILHEAARLVGLRHQAMADESRQFTESCKLSRLVLEGGIDNMVKAEEELKELKKMCMGLADRVETLKSYTKIKSERRVARQVAKESALLSPAELFEIEEPVQSPASVEDANDRTLEASTRHDGSHKSPEDEEELFEMEERFEKNIPARALFDYKASELDELDIETGSSMMLIGLAQEGWYVAKQHDQLGLVPANYVEKL